MNPLESGQPHTDAYDLVKRSIEGDLSAFRKLMETQQHYAYVLAFRLLHHEEDARDVVQEAFIRVWNNLTRYKPEVKFTTWLYKIVVNLCYDRIKMESRRNTIVGYVMNLFDRGDVVDARDLHAELEGTDLCRHILSAAQKLPPIQNLVFHLRDVQDFSIGEIAEIVGISVASVRANLCYARKRLRVVVTKMQESEKS